MPRVSKNPVASHIVSLYAAFCFRGPVTFLIQTVGTEDPRFSVFRFVLRDLSLSSLLFFGIVPWHPPVPALNDFCNCVEDVFSPFFFHSPSFPRNLVWISVPVPCQILLTESRVALPFSSRRLPLGCELCFSKVKCIDASFATFSSFLSRVLMRCRCPPILPISITSTCRPLSAHLCFSRPCSNFWASLPIAQTEIDCLFLL